MLLVSEPAALMPAPSVTATIASATSTSISVKPRAGARFTAARRRSVADHERADAVGHERQPLVVEAQDDPLLADQRLGPEDDGARADHLRRRAGVEPARRQRRPWRRGRRSGSRCRRPASRSGSQRAGTPEARASARADSSRAASRTASCSSLAAVGSRRARLVTPVAIAMIATTSISSISVKPRVGARPTRSEAPAEPVAPSRPRRLGGSDRGASGPLYCQEPMSAFFLSPPTTPSAPKL